MPSMSNRNLVQIRDAAQSAGFYGKKTVLEQTIENLSNLSNVQAMIRLEGSPFVDLAALSAAYANDDFLAPENAEFVIVGTDLFFIRPDLNGSVVVPGWTAHSLIEFATVDADVTGLQSSINTLSSQVNSIDSTYSIHVSDIQGSILAVQADLSNEVSRAQTAESTLSGRASNLESSVVSLGEDLTDEVTRAQGAEQTLADNVATVQTNLDNESARAQGAEEAIAEDVTVLTEIVDAIVPTGSSSQQN